MTALAADTGVVPLKIGPGARWPGNNGFWGSTRPKMIAANPVTMNWGMTMKTLWMPYRNERNESNEGSTSVRLKAGRTDKDDPRF